MGRSFPSDSVMLHCGPQHGQPGEDPSQELSVLVLPLPHACAALSRTVHTHSCAPPPVPSLELW